MGIVALWRVLWRNKLRIAIPAVVLGLLAALMVLRAADTYSVETQILLTRGNLDIIELDGAARSTITSGEVSNALTILDSRSLALQVIDRLGLIDDPAFNPNLAAEGDAPRKSLVNRLIDRLKPATETQQGPRVYSEAELRQIALDWLAGARVIAALPGSNVIVVRATTPDPQLSADVANAYAELYLDTQIDLGRAETRRAARALEDRVSELRLRLEADQIALQDYQGSAQGITPDALRVLTAEAANLRARLETLRAATATGAGTAAATGAGTGAGTAGAPDRTRQLETALRTSLAELEAKIARGNAFLIGLRQREVEVETTAQVYESALARLKELNLQTGLRDAGAQILARAEVPLRSDAQGRRRVVGIAGVLGLFLGMAYVLLREGANDRIRRAAEMTALTGTGMAVCLPPLRPRRLRDRILRRAGRGAPDATGPDSTGTAPFFEGIRALRQSLMEKDRARRAAQGAPAEGRATVAGILSALQGDGKTTVTRALAQGVALIGQAVLVIDADMRSGGLTRVLGVTDTSEGLSDLLADGGDPAAFVLPQPALGVDLLACGQRRAHPADLLEPDRLGALIETLRPHYDLILIDMPPLLPVPETRRIAACLDLQIVLARHDVTPRAALRDALAMLREAGPVPMLAALSDVPAAFGADYGQPRHGYPPFAPQG